ncbi:kinase-like protein [Rhizophagus irregularis]|uniref:Kinase-like protein n=1 Tax=Rhizophagus irregularis TaxID=588596 RepID=A0A2N0P8J7_9GLOM|nr:kinase-like protein [Rhizophagus irregularis]
MTSIKKWIDEKIESGYIRKFEYDEFSQIDKIGEGAFGIVNKANLANTGLVALKIIISKSSDEHGEVNDEFIRELELLREVDYHPKINRCLGIMKDSGKYILVLDYANEGNLRNYLRKKFISLKWKDKIQMALDITMNNGKLLIADLGLSKRLAEITTNSKGNTHGMTEYIEPQCFKNNRYKKDKRSDIYSLGVLLWEISSGQQENLSLEKIAEIYFESSRMEIKIKQRELKEMYSAYQNIQMELVNLQQKNSQIEQNYQELKLKLISNREFAEKVQADKIINKHKDCYNEEDYKPWCKECVPNYIIEGWSSENHDVNEFIKDTIYNAKLSYIEDYLVYLEWVPFNRFKDINLIGEAKYKRQDDGSWKKLDPEPIRVALKKLNESKNISVEFLNELKSLWKLNGFHNYLLRFYGITKDPETEEFIMITQFAEKGNLRSFLSTNFHSILWKDKLDLLNKLALNLECLHELGHFHKNFHSGNILLIDNWFYISDFGLCGPSNEQKSDNKIYGVVPYIAPEVLNGKPYTLSSDIYSFGVIMAELSSGKPPFHKKTHYNTLILEICDGLRPEVEKGAPEIYKELAYKCMDANPDQRPTASKLWNILNFWHDCTIKYDKYQEEEKFGYKGKDIKVTFEEADKEIPNISTLDEIMNFICKY